MTTKQTQPEQLRLLTTERVPLALRLDERTRRIGLAGVAHARAILAAARQQREAADASAQGDARRKTRPSRAA